MCQGMVLFEKIVPELCPSLSLFMCAPRQQSKVGRKQGRNRCVRGCAMSPSACVCQICVTPCFGCEWLGKEKMKEEIEISSSARTPFGTVIV